LHFGVFGNLHAVNATMADFTQTRYNAIQEQIGLKPDATKAPVEVLVVDSVEKQSE
jgi:uncharacterized protein (TIGR03435 family)